MKSTQLDVADHYIDGKFVRPASGEYMDNHDPRTAEKIGLW